MSPVVPSRKLRTGFEIPLVGFGTYKVIGDDVLGAVDAALTAGYRLFDTAKYYKNEAELGEAFKQLLPKHNLTRADIFITSKMHPNPQNTVEETRRVFEDSLNSLQTDYIDMYLVHYPKHDTSDNDDPNNAQHRKDTYLTLEALKAEGKIRSVGVSNYEVNHLEEINAYGKDLPCANQLEYHPHFVRSELKEYCDKNDIFFQAFSSLARQQPDLINDQTLNQIAENHKTTVQLVLLAWALNQGVGIVPKSATANRIVENFKVVDLHLTKDEIASLTALDRNQHYIRTTGWLVK